MYNQNNLQEKVKYYSYIFPLSLVDSQIPPLISLDNLMNEKCHCAIAEYWCSFIASQKITSRDAAEVPYHKSWEAGGEMAT